MYRITAITFLFIICIFSPIFANATDSDALLSIVGKNKGDQDEDFRYQMGENLQVKVSGDLVEKIKTEWSKTKSITLYFDGERISDLKSPPIQAVEGKGVLLNFALVRNAENDTNRKAWDSLFMTKNEYLMTIQPSIAIGTDLPLMVQSTKTFKFYVASEKTIWGTLGSGVFILVATFFLLMKTNMLRDAETNYYSLGKSQMAFWGILVILSFVGVWILTGTMERIPPQVLMLLGISGATGLSALLIGGSKKAEKQNTLIELQREEQILKEQQANSQAPFSSDSMNRLDVIQKEINRLKIQLQTDRSKGFWRDICDDGNGASFHRLQVVVWTLVLGAVFVQNVADVMSMPEFPETLLTLMGISNATYVGFKIPEKS